MGSLVKWSLKFLAVGILWVFILSVEVKGRPLFYSVHHIFVQNQIVEATYSEARSVWKKVFSTASSRYDDSYESLGF